MLRVNMARSTRAAAAAIRTRDVPIRAVRTKAELLSPKVKVEAELLSKLAKTTTRKRAAPKTEDATPKRVKLEDKSLPSPKKSPSKKSTLADLRDKKLKAYAQYANSSPFSNFAYLILKECKLAHRILSSLYGARKRLAIIVAPTSRAGYGDLPSVLDALVRTILS